jgi:hypothetical protein
LKEREEEEDDDEERQTGRGKSRQDSKLKKTRIEIPGLY